MTVALLDDAGDLGQALWGTPAAFLSQTLGGGLLSSGTAACSDNDCMACPVVGRGRRAAFCWLAGRIAA